MSHPERVLVVPRAKLKALAKWQGYLPADRLSLPDVLTHAELRVRDEVEDDPTFKQVIPYTVFRWTNPSSRHRPTGSLVFCYTRGAGGAESRLHRKRSLGVGGHVDEVDFEGQWRPDIAYNIAHYRELGEEVEFGIPADLSPIGFLNDDSDPVGRVHLGIVHLIEPQRPDVHSCEPGTLDEAGWISVSLLPGLAEQFESWSRILIESGIFTEGA